MFNLRSLTAAALVALLAGCVSPPPAHDYTAFKEADPHSIIILPPLNNTPEVIAPYSVMTQMVAPIAESGFYVFPVAVVEQTLPRVKQPVALKVEVLDAKLEHGVLGGPIIPPLAIELYYLLID